MLLIRGNNVFPSAVEEVIRGFPILEFRMTARQGSSLADLKIEIEPSLGTDGGGTAKRLSEAIRDRFNFKPVVVAVDPGTLPRYEMKSRRLIRE
jgi:phenylacetate-CoA ligase